MTWKDSRRVQYFIMLLKTAETEKLNSLLMEFSINIFEPQLTVVTATTESQTTNKQKQPWTKLGTYLMTLVPHTFFLACVCTFCCYQTT